MRATELLGFGVRALELPAQLIHRRVKPLRALARGVNAPLEQTDLRVVRRRSLVAHAHRALQLRHLPLRRHLGLLASGELRAQQRDLLELPRLLRAADLHRLAQIVELRGRCVAARFGDRARRLHLLELD